MRIQPMTVVNSIHIIPEKHFRESHELKLDGRGSNPQSFLSVTIESSLRLRS